jgi:hypothetical protein
VADRRVTFVAVTSAAVPDAEALPSPRLSWWGAALAIFAGSRVLTTLLFLWVWSLATPRSRAGAHPSFLDLVSTWDGQWYWYIAEYGYPTALPLTASGSVDTNQWAFLPVYPYLSKLLTFGVLDWRIPALLVSVGAGFGAAVVLAALLLPRIGRRRALFAVALLSCSPLAFMFQTTYAESLGLLLLLGVLVLVDRRRYLAAVPVALVLAFTRPGILAVALAVGLQLALRLVRARRGGPAVPKRELLSAILLAGVCAAAGFAWSGIAGFVTGQPDAYFATESAWRALWMPGSSSITLFTPWLFAADFWATRALGSGPAGWAGPLVLGVLVAGFAGFLLTPRARRLGSTTRLWAASYALYLLAVFFPQSSVFRLLMPMAPLVGAITPRYWPARILVLVAGVGLQALWLWACYGPVQDYWTVP